jgi:hypothetical protein
MMVCRFHPTFSVLFFACLLTGEWEEEFQNEFFRTYEKEEDRKDNGSILP